MCNNKKHCSFANHCGFDDSWRLQKLKNDKVGVQRSVNMCRSELFSDSANLILDSLESHCDTATSATAPRWPPWPSDLQTSKLIVTSYFCVGDMFWWPPATGATSLHPSPRLLSLPPESSESSWLSSESPEFPIYNSSWISASCSGPSASLSSSMGWSVLTSLWTWVLAQILPSEGED